MALILSAEQLWRWKWQAGGLAFGQSCCLPKQLLTLDSVASAQGRFGVGIIVVLTAECNRVSQAAL